MGEGTTDLNIRVQILLQCAKLILKQGVRSTLAKSKGLDQKIHI